MTQLMLFGWFASVIVFAVLLLLLYGLSKETSKGGRDKTRMYACGEKWEPEQLPAGSVYRLLVRQLGIERLEKMHRGDLSTYLLWILLGLLALVFVIALL